MKPDEKPGAPLTGPECPDTVTSFSQAVPSPVPAPEIASHPHQLRHEIRVWTRDLLIAIGLALVIIVFLYQPVKVEGTSMAPLLSDQERIFINKFVYRFEAIERGDVVVFWYPLDRSKSFIKRVVGLARRNQSRFAAAWFTSTARSSPSPMCRRVLPTFRTTARRKVPDGSYFVMGDHRISSNDSRVFGPVASQFIYGHAVFAYWPVDHFGSFIARPKRA